MDSPQACAAHSPEEVWRLVRSRKKLFEDDARMTQISQKKREGNTDVSKG
jgi:hypothetical protein